MPPFLSAFRPEVSRDALAATVAHLSALGEKVPGSAAEAAACAYLTARLAEYGVRHQVHVFDSYIGAPTRTELHVLAPAPQQIEAVGVAFAGDTGPEGVTAPVVAVGRGRPADYAGRDVAGAIVLVDHIPEHGACAAALRAGVVGLIGISSGPQRHKMTVSPIWGAPATAEELAQMPRLAVASISRPDGERLKALAASGGLRVRLVAQAEEGWRQVRLPVAEIPGREAPFVLVGSHYCTWFDGTTDNITANALLLECARLLAPGAGSRRYGVRLAWWPGHTHGRYSGSAWYADTFWQDLHENGIAYFNVDIVGSRGAVTKCARNQMAEVSGFTAAALAAFAEPVPAQEAAFNARTLSRQDRYVDPTRPHRGSDQSFWGVGLSSLQVSSFLAEDDPAHLPNSGIAWWWHTAQDTLDKADPDILAADTAIHARMVDSLADAPLLPLDLAATAGDMLAALREYREAAPDLALLAELETSAQAFAATAARFQACAADLTDSATTSAANRRLLRAAHLLNPVLYQARSPFEHDRAVPTRLLPGLAPALGLAAMAPDAARMARVGLQRERNRIAHALAEATRLLDAE
ncbi:M28 family peptidase [Limobrevibacterium gyesilva]|uniref:M28 family peptidase n=1 Tax=Limobrevibacterium gyesilva TaxID=2991712 RepID=A0AA41YMI0_9PROT|nr:M28 family peptidase [Limobrevibacterium gyesilva]MCW3475241.1 M28 family peptidase [Limobrevibacterium gyesilva]